MKFIKIITSITTLIFLIGIANISFAKYVFEDVKTAAIIEIDRTSPLATINTEIIEITNNNEGYENYANKKHQITIKVKISFEQEVINKLSDFIVFVGTNQDCCSKEIKLIESDKNNIIYEINLTNITENGELILKIPEGSFEDSVGNKMSERKLNTGIKIDNISPELEFSQGNLEDGKIVATITSNEKIRNTDGWQIDESQTIISKEFLSNVTYKKIIKDLAGNSGVVQIDIKNATGFEFIGYISDTGWMEPENNIVGTITGKNSYKIEGLAFRTGDNIDNDYLRISSYVSTYWGEGALAIDPGTNEIYNHGYNPISGYKTMQNSELVTINSKQYVQVGGEGVNRSEMTDINGENPIPEDIAVQYKYGITRVKLELKDYEENCIIYQLYRPDQGWVETAFNGTELYTSFTKPIQGIRIAIIPISELACVKQDWDQFIGTHLFK